MKMAVLVIGLLLALPLLTSGNFSREDLVSDMKFLTDPGLDGRKAGTDGEKSSADYLKSKFQDLGFLTEIHEFSGYKKYDCSPVKEGTSRNVVASWPGTGKSFKTIVIGAHFDGVVHPAANDNASGTAGLLVLARLISDSKKYPWNSNLVLASFSSEEIGLCGSLNFVKETKNSFVDIEYMVNMDMIGQSVKNGETKILYVLGDDENENLRNSFLDASAIFNLKIIFGDQAKLPYEWWSDHGRFHDAGIPAVMLIGGNNTDHHSVTDTEQKIEYDYLESVVRLLYFSLRNLDKR